MSFPSSGSAVPLGLLSPLYAGVVALRGRLFDRGWIVPRRLPVPVISIGNLTAGGTGKSPMVRLIAAELARRGKRPAVVSRGYGGRHAGAALVVSEGAGAIVSSEEAGDEPVMLADQLAGDDTGPGVPVVVARRRADGGALALARFSSGCVVLDDGFQHRALARDLDLLLLDATEPFGNGRLLPAGLLREPVAAMGRAGAIVVTNAGRGAEDPAIHRARETHCPAVPLFRARSRPAGLLDARGQGGIPIERLHGATALCFAGIARPGRFFDDVRATGASVAAALPFADHHRFTPRDVDRIRRETEAAGARWILTTEKDLARLGETRRRALGERLHAIRMETSVDEPGRLAALLAQVVP